MQLINATKTHLIFLADGNTYSYRHHLELSGDVSFDPETSTIIQDGPSVIVPQEMIEAILNPPEPIAPQPTPEELLARAKTDAFNRAKTDRDNALAGGFEFAGVHYQTRNASDVSNITGVGLAAIIANGAGQPFSVDFRATDNTARTMDGPTATMFYLTMVGAAQAIWGQYNARYSMIAAAQTVEEVEAL